MPASEPKPQWDQISRRVRSNMGLGRDKFARLLNVSPRTVMRWENPVDGEEVKPQSVQRMKLLALSLHRGAVEEQRDVVNDLLEQAAGLRSRHERKATTIREYDLEIGDQAPDWFRSLHRLRREKNWSALSLVGPHFLEREPGLGFGRGPTPRVQAILCLWIGNGFFMQGEPRKAVEFYDRGLVTSGLPALLRAILWSNKGYALIRLHDAHGAEAALEESLRSDPGHRGALRNRMSLHSLAGDEGAAYGAAHELAKRYPDANEAASELGQALLGDPDLKNFRATKSFARAFPGLAKQTGGKP